MDKSQKILGIEIMFLVLSVVFVGLYYYERSQKTYNTETGDVITDSLENTVNCLPRGSLTGQEKQDFLYMREEENLTRDVYLALYEKVNATIFSNIAKNEQTLMDVVLPLINKYELTDPVGDNGVDVFKYPVLQDLYTLLVENGSASLEAAYTVAVMIEETDIVDLDECMNHTELEDVQGSMSFSVAVQKIT